MQAYQILATMEAALANSIAHLARVVGSKIAMARATSKGKKKTCPGNLDISGVLMNSACNVMDFGRRHDWAM